MQCKDNNMEQEPHPLAIANLLHDQPQWMLGGQVVLLPITQHHSFQANLQSAISELSEKIIVVGYDWMGRPIGVSSEENNTLLLCDLMFDELMEFDFFDGRLESSPLFDPTLDNFGQGEYSSFIARLHLPR